MRLKERRSHKKLAEEVDTENKLKVNTIYKPEHTIYKSSSNCILDEHYF